LFAALVSSGQSGQGQQAEIRLLTVEEAAAKLGVTREWVYRRGKGLGLAVKLTDGTLRFSSVALDAYINGQTISTAPPARRRRQKADSGDLTG
jgi:predicted DNA-binding transcriptional regulator AlpA